MTLVLPKWIATIAVTSLLPCLSANAAVDQMGRDWPEKLMAWRHAKTAKAKRHAREEFVWSAMRADRPDLVEMAIAGGKRQLRESEIHVRRRATRVRLELVHEFPELHAANSDNFPPEPTDWLARRITADAFEVWSPKHGWLFDRNGQLLNEAIPPRRDGVGRKWFGAFLPDGQWVTTDLWEWDRVLTFFSRDGKWLKEIPGATLVPRAEAELKEPHWLRTSDFVISWARSDKDGRGWIVQVGTDGGRGRVWITPDGAAERSKEEEGYGWRRCYPRQLGPRGSSYWGSVPDDSGKLMLGFHVMAHGFECAYPDYFTGESPDYGATVKVPYGEMKYGFWPDATDFFVVATHWLRRQDENSSDETEPTPSEIWTWFFDRDADFLGWIRAERLADGADGKTMLFRTKDDRVVMLDRQRRVRGVQRFVLGECEAAPPLVLFADLHLGLFGRGDEVVLARWRE